MSMTRQKAQTALTLAAAIMAYTAKAAISQEDRQTNDMLAVIFCGLSFLMMLGLTGHAILRCLNHNPSDRFFKPAAQPDSQSLQPAAPAKKL